MRNEQPDTARVSLHLFSIYQPNVHPCSVNHNLESPTQPNDPHSTAQTKTAASASESSASQASSASDQADFAPEVSQIIVAAGKFHEAKERSRECQSELTRLTRSQQESIKRRQRAQQELDKCIVQEGAAADAVAVAAASQLQARAQEENARSEAIRLNYGEVADAVLLLIDSAASAVSYELALNGMFDWVKQNKVRILLVAMGILYCMHEHTVL